MENEQAKFEGWARVEVMGHQTHIGFVRTEAYGQAVMFRIDTPEAPEREFVLESPEYCGNTWTPAGSKVKRASREGGSVLVGAGSIYRIVPLTETAALHLIDKNSPAPLKLVALPEGKALPAPEEPEQEDDDEDDYEHPPECAIHSGGECDC
jgi:hypothetical protein